MHKKNQIQRESTIQWSQYTLIDLHQQEGAQMQPCIGWLIKILDMKSFEGGQFLFNSEIQKVH
jgi:hypothetical protein